MVSDLEARIRNVTAVLGPTNTGKTHLAIERMLGHESADHGRGEDQTREGAVLGIDRRGDATRYRC
jgi:hypothetical protein